MAYQRILKEKQCFSLPVFSIALSRLKHHEDPHIVRAIWDSTKAIMEHDLRQDITLFKGPIVIIGYGGLGAAMVDHFLLQKFEGIIRVFDIDPEKREAAKLKYSAKSIKAKIEVAEDITAALKEGILVIGAICSGEMFKKGQESFDVSTLFRAVYQ